MIKNIFIILVSVGLILSCEDIIVENIEDSRVSLIAPGDGQVTDSTTIRFVWESVNGALDYRFQLVSGEWELPSLIITDSILTETQITVRLAPGRYAWGVNAANSGYITNYSIRELTVDTLMNEADLSKNTVNIVFPTDNIDTLKFQEIRFEWSQMDSTRTYHFQIAAPNFSRPTAYFLDTTLTDIKLSLTLDHNNYEWQVRGENWLSKTPWTKNSLVVAPDFINLTRKKAQIVTPVDSIFFEHGSTITLNWNEVEGASDYAVSVQSSRSLIRDTVSNASIDIGNALESGWYQWIVTAINEFSSSQPDSGVFRVGLLPEDLSETKPSLEIPADGRVLQDSIITFKWLAVTEANNYQITIYSLSDLGERSFVEEDLITMTEYKATLDSGQYEWEIVASNSTSKSLPGISSFTTHAKE